jgi:hypothetical protein
VGGIPGFLDRRGDSALIKPAATHLVRERVWIDPLDALSRLGDAFGELAKPAITARLKAGKLKTRVNKVVSYLDYGHMKRIIGSSPSEIDALMLGIVSRLMPSVEGVAELGPATWTGSV